MSSKKETAGTDRLYGSTFSAESIKVIAESIGINALSDDAASELAEDVTGKIKSILQDALKFMNHSKRDHMLSNDIDSALKVRNIEPLYGFQNKDSIPFRFASGGGRELHTTEDKEIELDEVVSSTNLKIPLNIAIRSHWLAVDGEQPEIPENPVNVTKKDQEVEAVNPVVGLDAGKRPKMLDSQWLGKTPKLRNSEVVLVKQLAIHELSVEQQLYYREITEACVGTDERHRSEALQSLSVDPGLYEMLPRICTFISEGVKVNSVQNNLAMLIYLIRMVKALMDNPNLYIERYLHELIPAVTTCIVSKQLCMRPEIDNHWALRDFSARLMGRICKTFNTSTNNLQTRITRIFSKSFENEKVFLTSLYGSIIGFSELGNEVVRVFILPHLKLISERIEAKLFGLIRNNIDKEAAEHIRTTILKFCVPILLQTRNPPDFVEEYRNEYGSFLGPSLCLSVLKSRPAPSTAQSTSMQMNNMGSYRMQSTSRHGAIPKSENVYRPSQHATTEYYQYYERKDS